jgi:hypothetical protein
MSARTVDTNLRNTRLLLDDVADPAAAEVILANALINPELRAWIDTKSRYNTHDFRTLRTSMETLGAKTAEHAFTISHPALSADLLPFTTVAEPIILRRRNDRDFYDLLPYADDAFTAEAREQVWRYNRVIQQHAVMLGDRTLPCCLARKFNDNFNLTGRFYTVIRDSYQNMPSKERARITIDASPTVELDYGATHLRMLKFCGDYQEIAPHLDRKLLKVATNIALNAASMEQAEYALAQKIDSDDVFQDLVTAERYIKAVHAFPPLANHVLQSRGLRLQRLDSEIAAHVLHDFVEAGKPILCIHDSFRVCVADQGQLNASMVRHWRDVVETDCSITAKQNATDCDVFADGGGQS